MTHDTKRIRIRQSRNETNLFGVRIRDYDTNPWIRETNPRFYESLIRIPHPYKLTSYSHPYYPHQTLVHDVEQA